MPLSETISTSVPHLQRMSSNSQSPSAFAVSLRSRRPSGHAVVAHRAEQTSLYPPDRGRWNESTYAVTKHPGGDGTVGGIRTCRSCLFWHRSHVRTYQATSVLYSGHQNRSPTAALVACIPRCPIRSWISRNARNRRSLSSTTLCAPSGSFRQSRLPRIKNCAAYLYSVANALSDIPSGRWGVSRSLRTSSRRRSISCVFSLRGTIE